MRCCSLSRPPAPAARPRVTSGRPNCASSLATTRSQESTSSKPPASAYPSTAAITGLSGGRSVMPPNPRPPAVGLSPVRNPFRSMPAQNVPPAPVRMRTRTSLRVSRSSMAAAMPAETAPLTAFRASGRLIVMTATPSSTSMRTSSATPALQLLWSVRARLLRLEPDAAVEPHDLGVHVVVLDQRAHQVGELSRRAKPLGKRHRRNQLGLELLAGLAGPVDGGVDDAGSDRVDPRADRREVTGRRDGHPDDAALGCRVGDLPGLPLDTGDRR